SDDGQRRIHVASRGKYRTTGNEQIGHPVHPAICVYDPIPRIWVHPSGPHVMVTAPDRRGPRTGVSRESQCKLAESAALDSLREELVPATNAAQVHFAQMQIQVHTGPTELIPLV